MEKHEKKKKEARATARYERAWIPPLATVLVYLAVSAPADLCPEGQYQAFATTGAIVITQTFSIAQANKIK